MSSIARFYRVPRSSLGKGNGIAELLAQAAALDDDYCWSGYVMFNLLVTLAVTGVNLGADLAEVIDSGDEAGAIFLPPRLTSGPSMAWTSTDSTSSHSAWASP